MKTFNHLLACTLMVAAALSLASCDWGNKDKNKIKASDLYGEWQEVKTVVVADGVKEITYFLATGEYGLYNFKEDGTLTYDHKSLPSKYNENPEMTHAVGWWKLDGKKLTVHTNYPDDESYFEVFYEIKSVNATTLVIYINVVVSSDETGETHTLEMTETLKRPKAITEDDAKPTREELFEGLDTNDIIPLHAKTVNQLLIDSWEAQQAIGVIDDERSVDDFTNRAEHIVFRADGTGSYAVGPTEYPMESRPMTWSYDETTGLLNYKTENMEANFYIRALNQDELILYMGGKEDEHEMYIQIRYSRMKEF